MPRILLVDDEENNLDMLKRRLEKRGFEVITASNGADACRQVPLVQPDLVLMDVMMPGMDGCEATRQLRQSPTSGRIPVIALTALAMPGDRERVFEAGCNDYATKPIDLPELLDKIQTLLNRPETTPTFRT